MLKINEIGTGGTKYGDFHKHKTGKPAGRKYEEEFFYRCGNGEKPRYLSFRSAMKQVIKSQPPGWDPIDPPTRKGNDFHALVCEALGEDDYSKVELFSSLDTAFDRYHGVDGFFKYKGEIVTVDLTLDSFKAENGHKADVIVNGNIEEAAAQVAAKLKEKIDFFKATGYRSF